MIRQVSIRNFKCLRDVEVDLERFTVLVGPNASGKSSILQALDFLCRAYRVKHPKEMEGEVAKANTDRVEFVATVGEHQYRYRTASHNGSPPKPPRGTWTGDERGVARIDSEDWNDWNAEPRGGSPFPLSVLLRLEYSKLAHSQRTDDPTVVSPNGSGLHSALANIALSDPDSWKELQESLRQIVPTVRRLRHMLHKENENLPTLLFDMAGAQSLTANQVSEGTLLVLGLLAVLYRSDRPSLLLLDDLDRGLHPRAQKELILLLRRVMEKTPDLQIVATTHSPYMLDCMDTSEVRMTYLRDDGSTVCEPLAHHPDFRKWKDEMTPGEMWSLFGEKWMVEQEAAK